MCLFRPKVKQTAGAPAIAPRQAQDTYNLKPTELADDSQVAVEYGSSSKKGGAAEANRTGTDALKIPLNEGGSSGESGGINV
tara:strand:- start:75 stop:320 length:246 start_codon:yes stop_codon:yes gene_type:complete